MSTSPIDLTDEQLADALRDLGTHLDLGPAANQRGRADLVAAVLAELPDRPADGAAVDDKRGVDDEPGIGRRAPRLLVAAAVVLVVVATTLAVAPAREAVARWLGIGGVRIVRIEQTDQTDRSDVSAPPATTAPGPDAPVDLDAVVRRLPFVVRLPATDTVGEPQAAAVDPAVPSGLLEVRYRDVTLVALASQPGGQPVLTKVLGPGTTTRPVRVGVASGLWITGDPHEVAFVDPDGAFQVDRVRRAGDVLLWEDDGVTYRIEGAPSLEQALVVARSLR